MAKLTKEETEQLFKKRYEILEEERKLLVMQLDTIKKSFDDKNNKNKPPVCCCCFSEEDYKRTSKNLKKIEKEIQNVKNRLANYV